MKNAIKLLGIIAMVAVIGFSMAACGDGNEENKQSEETYIPPEKRPVAERWRTDVDTTSGVTLTCSVADDGVCTITVGGKAADEIWKASAYYKFTGKADASYTCSFEAWTASENEERNLNVQYYDDYVNNDYRSEQVSITNERKTYTIEWEGLPKDGEYDMPFQCGNKLGTFFVKILEIKMSSKETP